MKERDSTSVPWSRASTFSEWIIRMIEQKKTKEPEFIACLNYWGRERIEKIWKEHLERKKAQSK